MAESVPQVDVPFTVNPDEHPIVFFDGVCNLCNGFIDFLVRRDTRRRLRYAPLQGVVAKRTIPELVETGTYASVALVDHQGIHLRSTAALRVIASLGGLYRVAAIFLLVPPFLRDAVYGFIAKNRYRFFGKKDSCRLPSPAERTLFLD